MGFLLSSKMHLNAKLQVKQLDARIAAFNRNLENIKKQKENEQSVFDRNQITERNNLLVQKANGSISESEYWIAMRALDNKKSDFTETILKQYHEEEKQLASQKQILEERKRMQEDIANNFDPTKDVKNILPTFGGDN